MDFEELAQNVALAKAAMPVLGKRRMVWDLAVQAEAAEPAIGEIEMHFLAQAAFRANAQAIADKKHADHQLRIDRGAAGAAVERLQRGANAVEIEMPIDPAQLMVLRHMIVEAEIIEKPSGCCLSPHHRRISCKSAGKVNHEPRRPTTIEFFNKIRHKRTLQGRFELSFSLSETSRNVAPFGPECDHEKRSDGSMPNWHGSWRG